MNREKLSPIHPGEVLLEEFLVQMGLSQNRLALSIGVPPRRINEIVLGKRRITAETALRLARYFGNSPQFWLGLQSDYDLDVAADVRVVEAAPAGHGYRNASLQRYAGVHKEFEVRNVHAGGAYLAPESPVKPYTARPDGYVSAYDRRNLRELDIPLA